MACSSNKPAKRKSAFLPSSSQGAEAERVRTDNVGSDNTDADNAPFKERLNIDIELFFHYHLTWGYPDFVRDALRVLLAQGRLPDAYDEEVSWKQLRQILDSCSATKIKYYVAGQDNTTPAVLNYLSDDASSQVCRRIAENPRCHKKTLTQLSRHPNADVRCAVSEHRNTPPAVLKQLACDEDADVRYYLAENGQAPEDVLDMLCQDENPFVSSRAHRTMRSAYPASNVVPAEFATMNRSKRQQAK